MTEQTRRKPKEREVDNEQLKLEVVPSKHEFNLDGITRGHSRLASFSNNIGDELNTMMTI
jgi:hypothetical protein